MSAESYRGEAEVRGTQSFVYTMSACWRRPSLTALEVLWRWGYGAPALLLVGYEALRIWRASGLDVGALGRISLLNLQSSAGTLTQMWGVLASPLSRTGLWLAPLLAVAWAAASAWGRTAVLRRADPELHSRPGVLLALHVARMMTLAAAFGAWWLSLRADAAIAIWRPVAAGEDPNPVLYAALVIVTTLAAFTAWAAVSWVVSFAPLVAMRTGAGVWASVRGALRMRAVRGKLVEVNLVMGIVKIALLVLAMVFSASPLPFESVTTPGFLEFWYGAVTLLYLLGSDFFHVVQLVAYLNLWRTLDADGGDARAGAVLG